MVESADSGLESADSTIDYSADPVKISLWVWAFSLYQTIHYCEQEINFAII